MAGDSKQFRHAYNKWKSLRDSNTVSLPTSIGKVAIIYSDYHDVFSSTRSNTINRRKKQNDFKGEAKARAKRYQYYQHRQAEIINAENGQPIHEVLNNPEYSDIITIGHGALTHLIVDNPSNYMFDWFKAITSANHLKQGRFTQRQCGSFARRLNVPLGAFVVIHPSQVIAATGLAFEPTSLDHTDNRFLSPFTDQSEITYESCVSYIEKDSV